VVSIPYLPRVAPLPRGPFRARKLAKWSNKFPVDLMLWQQGKSEATGVLIGVVLGYGRATVRREEDLE